LATSLLARAKQIVALLREWWWKNKGFLSVS